MVSNLNINIPSIIKGWEHKACDSINKKVDMFNVISFEVNVLVISVELWFQQGTKPGDEGS
jgi:hypothetical protein